MIDLDLIEDNENYFYKCRKNYQPLLLGISSKHSKILRLKFYKDALEKMIGWLVILNKIV